MTREQLSEMILEMYTLRPDAKAYFDFFMNPDVEKLYGKCAEKIDMEFRRCKCRRSKARISKVKAVVKDFASFNPGSEYVVKLRLHALLSGFRAVKVFDYSHLLLDSMILFLEDSLKYADKNLVFREFVSGLEKMMRENEAVFEGVAGRIINEQCSMYNVQ